MLRSRALVSRRLRKSPLRLTPHSHTLGELDAQLKIDAQRMSLEAELDAAVEADDYLRGEELQAQLDSLNAVEKGQGESAAAQQRRSSVARIKAEAEAAEARAAAEEAVREKEALRAALVQAEEANARAEADAAARAQADKREREAAESREAEERERQMATKVRRGDQCMARGAAGRAGAKTTKSATAPPCHPDLVALAHLSFRTGPAVRASPSYTRI